MTNLQNKKMNCYAQKDDIQIEILKNLKNLKSEVKGLHDGKENLSRNNRDNNNNDRSYRNK